MRECRMAPIGANVFGIQIENRDDGQIKGLITSSHIPRAIPFTSLSRMILLLDEQMDIDSGGVQEQLIQQPEHPTFELEILFRQNYSWQGRLRWPGGGKEATFRSVLELLTIIETILEQ